MFEVFKHKRIWSYLLVIIGIIAFFSFAQFGPRTSVKVRHIPVAIVDEDHSLASEKIVDKLQNQGTKKNAAIHWVHVANVSKLTQGYADGRYFGAVILTKHFSKSLTSQTNWFKAQVMDQNLRTMAAQNNAFTTTDTYITQRNATNNLLAISPQKAEIKLEVSQGNNMTAASLLTTALPKMATALNTMTSTKFIAIATKENVKLTPTQLTQLQKPIKSTMIVKNRVSTSSISGMAPLLTTILLWIGSMIGSLLIRIEHKKRDERSTMGGGMHATTITSQWITGLLFSATSAGSLYFFSHICYKVPIPHTSAYLLTATAIAFVFFLIQSAVINWLGIPGAPLMIMTVMLSTAVVTYPATMLSNFYRTWIYSWTPIRYAQNILINQLYLHGKGTMSTSILILGVYATCGLMLMYLSSKKTAKQN
ncbi:hypothetical protein LROSL1_2470 [Furfurilactobacillus rossiae]|uniref:YhgE/Pip domain-containing protein n=1 Tax=Furfurilactobacillus rossiae TaxID=231049 RepID=UPI0015BA4CBB|nr:ABC transporter permease [Furfurilactobacillus rossiae]QLE65270.1 hypothetical protein LROSL1_2470 [Furfurilactobacillus rossiae]